MIKSRPAARRRVLPVAEPTRGEFRKVMDAGRLRKGLGYDKKRLRGMIVTSGLEATLQKMKMDAQGRRALNRMLSRKNPRLLKQIKDALNKPGTFLPEVREVLNTEFAPRGAQIQANGTIRFMEGMEADNQDKLVKEIEEQRAELTHAQVVQVFSTISTKIAEVRNAFATSEMEKAIAGSKNLTELTANVLRIVGDTRR